MRAWILLAIVTVAATARADDKVVEHELRAGGAVEVAVGARGAASLTIVPAAGRRLDASAPLSVRLSIAPAAGVKLPRRRYVLADAADPRAEAPRFDLPLEGVTAGTYVLTVEARFWLCALRTCRPVRDQVDIPVTVTASAERP
jgi:hypothetical protein